MKKYIFSFILVPVLFVAFVTPAYATSNSVQYYQTGSQQQQIAYLYALVAQLQAQLAALQGYPVYTNGGTSSSNEITRVVTGSVDSDGDDSVTMEGEITFRRESEARVWFEYGTSNKLSYSTQSQTIDGDSGDTEDFDLIATDLNDNKTYYYRAVAEDKNGRYVEGAIKSFKFDGRNDDNDDRDDNDTNNGDWSLEVDDDTYQTGDSVRVDYEVDDTDNDNWIGLYKVGARDSNYLAFKYVKDDEGYVSFKINNDGEYEFRLFDADDDKVATSDEFEVEN